MKQKDEKWAVFWCELLKPVLYEEIGARDVNRYLKEVCQKEVVFPDGRVACPSLSNLTQVYHSQIKYPVKSSC